MIRDVEKLLERQIANWPLLTQGIEGLRQAKTRLVRIDWFDVYIRHIPHRIGSTTAPVDHESIARRPCFLCAANIPPEEEGLRYNEEFSIYCNPFPIVDRHLTIVHREHIPQRITKQLDSMLKIAQALPGYFIIYNGPECGASAPDHMHFQAGSRGLFPIERDSKGLSGTTVPGYRRNVLLLRDRDSIALICQMEQTLELLAETTRRASEPLVNIAAFYDRGEWVAFVFPRSKHRPNVFYTGELTVSPASIDLCGIVVVPIAQDFDRITGDTIAAIFQEVTLPDRQFQEVAEKLERER